MPEFWITGTSLHTVPSLFQHPLTLPNILTDLGTYGATTIMLNKCVKTLEAISFPEGVSRGVTILPGADATVTGLTLIPEGQDTH